MDWTDLNARDTCLLIKQNLSGADSATKMREHLLHDVRVRWALDNGMTPGGRFPAVPGGYAEFARQAQEWVAGGMGAEPDTTSTGMPRFSREAATRRRPSGGKTRSSRRKEDDGLTRQTRIAGTATPSASTP